MTQDLSEEDFIEIIQDLARLEPARCEYHIDNLAKKLKKSKKSLEACIRAERKKMLLEERKRDAEAKKAEAAASQGDLDGIVLDQGSHNEIARLVQIDMTSGANQGHFIFTDGWFYEWGGETQMAADGMPKPMYWQLMSDTAMEDRFIEKYDGATYGRQQARLRLGGDQFEAIRKHVSRRMLTKDFFNIGHKVIGINFLDGFLVIQRDGTYEFHEEHQPNFRQRRVIQIEWKRVSREIPERSVLHQFLSLYHAGDPDRDQKIRFMSQLAGVALAGIGASKQWIRHPLCVFLYGEDADSGKSTYLELLQAMVGEDNRCSVSAHDFDKPNCTARLIGKTVNVAGELTTVKTIDGEIFKKSITGEDIPAKILYQDTLTFKPMALHLFATNKLPPFAGGIDLGVQRRIGVLEFSKPIPATKRIPDVVEQIIENEFDLLIGFALDGLLQVIRDQDYTLPPSSVEALAHWVQATDLTKGWAEFYIEKLAPDPLTGKFHKSDGYFPTKLYMIFKDWCIEERGVPELKIPMFETFAERMGQMHPGCRRTRDTRQWFGIVLRLKPAASPEEQQAQQMADVQHDILHMPNNGIIDPMTGGKDGTTWH